MKNWFVVPLLLLALAGCSSQQSGDGGGGDGGGFGEDASETDGGDEVKEPTIVLDRSDVQQFRGTEMVDLLSSMEAQEPDDWLRVRRHVYPVPRRPYDLDEDGRIARRNFDWPPEDPDDLNDNQRKWRSYLLWPEHIRELLQKKDWDSEENRRRLSNYGRMYALLHEFQTRSPYASPTRETEYWSRFAESLLAYGKDGEELLISNMIVSMSNPIEDVCLRAQDILVQVGDPAIEPLCASMWTSHRQLVMSTEEEIDPETGRRFSKVIYKVFGNPNYNKYISDTLYRIGPRVVPQAIYELEYSLNSEGKSIGTTWRYRRYFVELLGRLHDPKALRSLEAEIDRVVVEEYDPEALRAGKRVIDKAATDTAAFTWQGHLIEAIGELGNPEGIRALIKLWKMDDFHEVPVIGAIFELTGKRVRSLEDARKLAKAMKVDLKGE